MKLEVIEVHWLDSVAGNTWTEPEEIKDPTPIISVGFIARESSQFLTLTMTPDIEVIPYLSIPKQAIVKRKILCRLKMK